ncbi:hypothetical protein GTX14_30275 [Streptomyces sp. SID4944]|nr:hypothetical protein [Streptomyces sp. SID4944]
MHTGHRRRRPAARTRPPRLPARSASHGPACPDRRLRHIGSVGTGWSDTERQAIAALLATVAADTCPFTERPPSLGRTGSGPTWSERSASQPGPRAGRLRHPSWHRLRPDLTPEGLS